jgi:uncharacterized OsmC-like protein
MGKAELKEEIINGLNTTEFGKVVEDIKQNPDLGQCRFRVKNEWVSCDENRSSTHGFYAANEERTHKKVFNFQAGEPALLQGKDEGANPVEFLLSALSGCMTTTIAYYAALNGQTIEKMESTYEGDLDLQGLLGLKEGVRPGYQKIQVNFKIKSKAPKAEIEQWYKFSPVFDVIAKSVPVEVKIEVSP